ncbi:MAG TPA: primosomal protein N' [Thermoanaerobaculia bacterium]|nr:primosomal protein N' [Thermoanaerobaculia bacterium]
MRRVGLLLPNRFPGLPSYRLPDDAGEAAVGARVAAPFGSALLTGLVADVHPPEPPEGTTERDVVALLEDEPFLPPALVNVLVRAAAYYVVAPGEMLRAAVPGRLIGGTEAVYVPGPAAVGASTTGLEGEVLALLLERGEARLPELVEAIGRKGLVSALKRLVGGGLARIRSENLRAGSAPSDRAFVARPAASDHPALARAPKRRALHAHLLALGRPASADELRAAGASPAVLSALAKAGLVTAVETERRADLARHVGPAGPDRRPVPTPAQHDAIDAIARLVASRKSHEILLDGVTGSGKTEVYLAALESAVASGRRGILLVPEIALAPALVRRLVARFGDRVSLLHSGLSEGERAGEWERARRGDVSAVVGPRSAVFAPLPDLGLVVLDEAHDASYKQAESPRYDARDVARVRAREEGATVVFGSATPSMELERAAREGRLPRLALPERPGARPRAAVEVIDLRGETAKEGDHGRILFAARTVQILSACFERGEQAIVLLNRRGFSPSLLCRACGEDFRCRNCSVARTYHRRNESLLCHYCGDVLRRPERCPACGSDPLQPVGFGTERLGERFAETFPGVSHAVLDRDAAARRGGAAGVLLDFETGRAQALLGTQMVAKGHDFPNATALAVLDADALLSFPDFRAAERTFQLVTQAAGRVGRGDKPGIVAVQTSRPDHEAIRAAVRQDHVAFADAELRFRKAFRYPPYTRLLLALFADRDLAKAHRTAREAFAALQSSAVAATVKLLGPAPAPLERLKGLWRYHILVKAEKREAIAETAKLLASLPDPPKLDVDPQNLL